MLGYNMQFFKFFKSLNELQEIFHTSVKLPCRLKVDANITICGSNEFSNLHDYTSNRQGLNALAEKVNDASVITEVNNLLRHHHDRHKCDVSVPNEAWKHLMFIADETTDDYSKYTCAFYVNTDILVKIEIAMYLKNYM